MEIYLETLLNWDEESVITVGGEQRFFLVDYDALIEAANAMGSNLE
jgi:hypothetical protein